MGPALWWAVGAAVASIPIVIHLLHRQRTQPVLWGAMMFLRNSALQQKRRKRVEDWLLLLLRVLALALLVFLLGRPLWKATTGVTAVVVGRPAADIAVVVDHSLSTRWKAPGPAGAAGAGVAAGAGKADADKTLFDRAVDTVAGLGGPGVLKPNDTVSIVLAERTPRKVSPSLVSADGVAPLVEALRKVKPGATRASIPEAVLAAREVLARGRNARKVIYVLSDGQRTNWEPTSLDKWAGAVGRRVKGVESNLTIYELPMTSTAGGPAGAATPAAGPRTNLAVLDVAVDPKVIGRDRRATVTATVKNTGGTPVSGATVGLWVNGKPASPVQPQPTLAPGDSRTVQFDYEFTALNSNAVEVRLDAPDGFDADNVAAASAFVLPAVPVLIVDAQGGGPVGDPADPATLERYKGSAYLTSAMLADAKDVDAPAFLAPTVVSYVDGARLRALADGQLARTVRGPDGTTRQEKIGLDAFAAVILNDVPRLEPALQAKLLDYCRGGHGLWYILGPKTEPAFVRDQMVGGNLFRLQLDVPPAKGPAGASVPVDVKDPEYEVLRPFASAERNVLTGMTTLQWWRVTPQEGDARVPLATAGTTPGAGGGPATAPAASSAGAGDGSPAGAGGGDPLILERAVGSAGGRVIVWTSPVDGISGWNNWPTMKAFAPMVNLTAYRLAGGLTKGHDPRVESGKALVWASPVLRDAGEASALGTAVGGAGVGAQQLVFPDGLTAAPVQWAEAVSPSGVKARVRPVTRDGRQWAFFGDTFEPGKYEVRFDNPKLPPVFYGVGIDPAELDETTLTADDRKWLSADDHKFVEKTIESGDLVATLSTGGAADKGTELWPWLAGGLLALLLFETFMTYRMVRRQAGPAVPLGAVPTGTGAGGEPPTPAVAA